MVEIIHTRWLYSTNQSDHGIEHSIYMLQMKSMRLIHLVGGPRRGTYTATSRRSSIL